MISNDKFFEKWEATHEKGMFEYLAKSTAPTLITVPLVDLIFYMFYRPLKKEMLNYMIIYCILIIIITLTGKIFRWINFEKRFQEILQVRKEVLENK